MKSWEMRQQNISKGRIEASERQANCCKYCFEPFSVSPATADHRTPKSRGGSNLSHNIDACCVRCNMLKGSMSAGQFLKRIKTLESGSLEMALAYSRRRIWLSVHRSCRGIANAVGMEIVLPIGRKE